MTETLAPTPDWGAEVVIVPYSGIQFLDFGFSLDAVDARRRRFLWLERVVGTRDGHDERMLIPLTGSADADAAHEAGARGDDTRYTIRDTEALEPFLSKWVPVPVLKVARDRGPQGEELYDAGPTTWARLRIVELSAPDARTGHTHRIQLALDTRLEAEAGAAAPGLPEEYLAPRREDARQECDFRLVADPRRIGWFLTRPVTGPDGEPEDLQRWVSDWISDMMRGIRRKPDALLEHWARYLSLLGLIDAAVRVPRLRLANTVGGRDARSPIEVDLVLDVGNARTCGIFIERVPGETAVAIDRAYRLELRDLSRPEFLYRDLFESRIEFADHRMGDDLHASNSGRRDAFLWPSFCRIGPEAMRMVAGTSGTETDSGLSSPKRYLWDGARRLQDWRFHDRASALMLPRVVNAALPHLTEDGDLREQIAADRIDGIRPRGPEPMMAQNPRFSRSSLFTFLLTEIFAHAIAQVNAPGSRHVRAQADRPRRLARIILTMPTATTAQEQAIIQSRASGALRLVRRLMGAGDGDSNTSRMPALTVEWDEASCTQLVYLYAELVQKFEGRIERFLTLMGRPRPRIAGGAAAPSLRLACIDIGGGTTDLMVTTYWGEADRMLHPVQTFREGFRVGGDELVNRVIARLILPQMQRAIEQGGRAGRGREAARTLRRQRAGDRAAAIAAPSALHRSGPDPAGDRRPASLRGGRRVR